MKKPPPGVKEKQAASRSHVERSDTLWWNCFVLVCFFFPQKRNTTASQECRGNTSHSVPRFHLMCLLAHVFNVTTPGVNHRKMQTLFTCQLWSVFTMYIQLAEYESSDCKIQSVFFFFPPSFSLTLQPVNTVSIGVGMDTRIRHFAAVHPTEHLMVNPRKKVH